MGGAIVCHPSHAARSFGSSPGTARIRVTSSTVLHVSAFDGSVHHLPLPYVDSRRAMIFASSSDSFGSDGGASTLPTFSRFSIRRSSAGTSTLSYFVDSFAKRVPASLAAWLARAAIASVSSVMKFCCTQPACCCSTPSFSVVSFAVSRNVFASAAVAGDDEEAVFVQPSAAAHAATTAARVRICLVMRTV